MSVVHRLVLLSVCLPLLAACAGGEATAPGPDEPPAAAEPSFRVTPDSVHFASHRAERLLTAYYDPGNGAERTVDAAWTTRDTAVAIVRSPGRVAESVGDGTTWLVATHEGLSDSVEVHVERIPVGLVVEPEQGEIDPGSTLVAEAYNVDAVGTRASTPTVWTSHRPDIARVESGEPTTVVTGIAPGFAWIIAEAEGFRDTLALGVRDPDPPTGDAYIRSRGDLDAWSGVTRIEGSLFVTATQLTELDGLDDLQEVTGAVRISDNGSLTTIDGLVKLERVGGGVHVDDNPVLRDLSGLTGLHTVGGTLSLRGSPELAVPAFGRLRSVGRLEITGVAGFSDPDILASLERVSEGLDFRADGPELRLSSLTDIDGTWRVGTPGPAALGVPALARVVNLEVEGSSLELFEAPALVSAKRIHVRENARLREIDLPRVREPEELILADNPALAAARFPSVFTAGNVSVGGSRTLTELDLGALRTAGRFSLAGLGLDRVTVPLMLVPEDAPDREILLNDMPALREVLVEATAARDLRIERSPALESVSLPRLERLHGSLYLQRLESLTDFEAPELSEAQSLRIARNPALESLRFPELESTSFTLILAYNERLRTVAMPLLRTTPNLSLGWNDSLEDLSFLESLTSGLGLLQIEEHARLTDIGGLARLGDAKGTDPIATETVLIRNNPMLPTAHVQEVLDSLEAKFPGEAFPRGVDTSGNGGG